MSVCIICERPLQDASVRVLKEKAVQALRQTSIDRGDEDIVKSLKNVTEISIHETCRRIYSDHRRSINNLRRSFLKEELSSSGSEAVTTPGLLDFDFRSCGVASQDLGVVSQDLDISLQRNQAPKNKIAIVLHSQDSTTQFCCVECPARFTEKEHMELHAVSHTKEYRYLCTICGAGLKRREHLDRHMLGHNEYRPHICAECGKGFKRKEHLTIHYSIHTGERNQVCPVCSKSFHRKDHLQKHVQTHSNYVLQHVFSIEDQLMPGKDQEFTENQAYGDEDMMRVKNEPDEDQMMNDTDEQIGEDMMEIELKVEPEETKVMNQDHHVDYQAIEKPYVCNCGKRYKRRDHLKIHSWTHVKKDKICSQCGKAFHREEQLFNHMSVHLNSGSLQPDLATAGDNDVSFMRALNLRPAGESNIAESVIKLDEDTDCDYRLKINDGLLVPRPLANSEKRPHECPICKKRFKRRQHLKAHENVHRRNANAIWCGLCHQGFQTDGQFQDHQCVKIDQVTKPDRIPDDNSGEARSNGKKKDLHARMKEMGYILPESIEIIDEEYQSRHREQKQSHEQVTKVNIPIENIDVLQHIHDNLDIQIEEYQDYSENDTILQEDQYTVDEQNIPVPKRVYVCKYCQKQFKRKDHFKIHLHIHTGVKSFFCPDCGKGFYRKDHLQKHSSVHSKERVFVSNLLQKPKKALPELVPISSLPKTNSFNQRNGDSGGVLPEITITAPSNSKLRVPLQIKVPYQMVVKDLGEPRTINVDPQQAYS